MIRAPRDRYWLWALAAAALLVAAAGVSGEGAWLVLAIGAAAVCAREWIKANRIPDDRTVTLLVSGNAKDPYTVTIEPWGTTYDLGGSDRIYLDLVVPGGGKPPELVAWPGGLSIYAQDRAVTRNGSGRVLHEF